MGLGGPSWIGEVARLETTKRIKFKRSTKKNGSGTSEVAKEESTTAEISDATQKEER